MTPAWPGASRVTQPGQESSKQSTDIETLRLANQQTQPIQTNVPDHVSHRGWSWPDAEATLGSSLIMFSNGTEKLKKQISQGFPSLVLCIVVAVAGCGPVYSYTVTPGSVDWADLWPRLLMSVISLQSLLCSCWHCTALLCSPLIKRLLPGATLKCYKLMCTRVRCRLILQLTDFTVTNKAFGLIMPWNAMQESLILFDPIELFPW